MIPDAIRQQLEPWLRNAAAVWPVALAAALLNCLFVIGGGLKPWPAIFGTMAFAAALLWRPQLFGFSVTTPEADQRLGRIGQAGGATGWPEILGAIPDPSIIVDATGRVIAANEPARSGLGVSVDRPISASIRVPEFLSAIDRAHDKRRPQGIVLRIPGPIDQRLRGIVSPLAAPGSADGELLMLAVLRDRTEEQQLSEMRADFVANASHELRTPLASLKGFIETLQGAAKDDPDARTKFLAIMEEQAGRMTRLIDDLLSLSRVEMHEHVVPRTEADLTEIVETAAAGLQDLAIRERRTLSVDTGDTPIIVRGDRDELLQVVQNLMQNAIKYGRDGGRVDVALKRDGNHHAIVVSDDGIGIAPEHLPRLTERFYRVSAKQSRDRGGTGLGLAIVKHIISRHRGELRIKSEPGKGSEFQVVLPAAQADAGQN